jgi:hypothetical protein
MSKETRQVAGQTHRHCYFHYDVSVDAVRLGRTAAHGREADRDSIGWFGWAGVVAASALLIETCVRIAVAIARSI